MTKLLVLSATAATLTLLATSSEAQAQRQDSAIGVGVSSTLDGQTGPALVVQAPTFHVEGILAFEDFDDNTDLTLAGRFWFQVSQTSRSDFSLGGGLGLLILDDGGPGGSDVDVELNLGAQIRAFIVSNVAVSASLGLVFVSTDGPDPIALTGDVLGIGGLTYFF